MNLCSVCKKVLDGTAIFDRKARKWFCEKCNLKKMKKKPSNFDNVSRLVSKRIKALPRSKKVAKRAHLRPIPKLKKDLETLSHTFIRKRDGINGEIKGYCIDCGGYSEGQQFQAGHWLPSGSSGALLRYHPHNMHGQKGGCNVGYVQERVKADYTLKMIDKYGREYVDRLRQMKNKTIKADRFFYQTMIDLYKKGDEWQIVCFLESYPQF